MENIFQILLITTMDYFTSLAVSILIGLLASSISIVVFRKKYIGVWAFFGGVAPDWPRIFLTPLGSTNLDTLLWATHTAGIFIFPVLLVLIDIPLMEIEFAKYIKPFNSLLPDTMKKVIRTEKTIEKLQKYKILPKPTRVGLVYLAAVFAGLVHLVANFFMGQL